MKEISLKQLNYLEIPLPTMDEFTNCYEWNAFGAFYYNYHLPELYRGDFVYFNYSCYFLDKDHVDLFLFLRNLHFKVSIGMFRDMFGK